MCHVNVIFQCVALLVRVLITVIKHRDHKQLGKEMVYFSTPLLGHTQGNQGRTSSRAGTWKQEQMERGAAYCLALGGLLTVRTALLGGWRPPNPVDFWVQLPSVEAGLSPQR